MFPTWPREGIISIMHIFNEMQSLWPNLFEAMKQGMSSPRLKTIHEKLSHLTILTFMGSLFVSFFNVQGINVIVIGNISLRYWGNCPNLHFADFSPYQPWFSRSVAFFFAPAIIIYHFSSTSFDFKYLIFILVYSKDSKLRLWTMVDSPGVDYIYVLIVYV